MKPARGFLYVATGKKYVDEAIFSATSCKKFNSYPVALITDRDDHELPDGLFDIVMVKPAAFNYRDKLLIRYSPFTQTIFLDTDTYVAGNLDDLFRILDYREFAIHQSDEGYEYSMPEVSNAMPEFNTGVIGFRLTENVTELMAQWEKSFTENLSVATDQYHLRKVLYESNVQYATFSSSYNFIIYHLNLVMQQVKILHGRPLSILPAMAADVNRIRHNGGWRRVYYPYNNQFGMVYGNPDNKDTWKFLKFYSRHLLGNVLRKLKGKNKP